MASTTIVVSHGSESGQQVKDIFRKRNPRTALQALGKWFHGAAIGVRSCKVFIGVDSTAPVTATGTIAPAQASITAGDTLTIGTPAGAYTFVATNGAVTPGQLTFDMRTSTAAVCTSIAAQVNAWIPLQQFITASATATTVTLTSRMTGTVGNGYTIVKVDTNNAAFVLNGLANTVHSVTFINGQDSAARAVGTLTPTQASITAGDIWYVGSTGFVATNGAVTPGQATFDMRTDTASVCASIAAQINARVSLQGVVSATATATVVTITASQPGAVGNHITLAKVDTTDASLLLNGLANTVHQSTLLNGAGGVDSANVWLSSGVR